MHSRLQCDMIQETSLEIEVMKKMKKKKKKKKKKKRFSEITGTNTAKWIFQPE
jgi:hypothetical protein